jgi:Flp pilus assembly protein CpaB
MIVHSWSLQRRWLRVRRPLAAACICGGILLAWGRLNQPGVSVPTVVAVADVSPGSVVSSTDVQVVDWPAESRPAPATSSPTDLVGRIAVGPILTGEPLTPQRVVAPSALGSGEVAVALPPDPLTGSGLVRPGDSVNLVGQSQTGPRTLAASARVLTLDPEQGAVVAIPAAAAASVTQAAATDSIAMALLAGSG